MGISATVKRAASIATALALVTALFPYAPLRQVADAYGETVSSPRYIGAALMPNGNAGLIFSNAETEIRFVRYRGELALDPSVQLAGGVSSWYPQLATFRGLLVATFVDTRPGLSGRLAFRISDDNGQTWGATLYPFGAETFNGSTFAPRVVADRDGQTLRVFSGSGIPHYRSSTDPELLTWTSPAPAGNGTMRPASGNSCSASSPECYRAHAFSFMETATPGQWIYVAKSPAGFGQSGRGTQVGTLGGSWSTQVDHGGSGGLTGCCGHSTATTMLDRDGNILFLRSSAAFIPLCPLCLSTDNLYYKKSTDGGFTWGPVVTAYSPTLAAHTTGAPVGLYVPGYGSGEYVWYTGWYPHPSVEHAARVIPIWTGPKPYAETGTTRLFGSGGGDLPDPNTAPILSLPADLAAFVHDGLDVAGSFSDPDLGQTWTATVNYGDGPGSEPLALADDHTFVLRHRYAEVGDYQVEVAVTDSVGATGTNSFFVSVDLKRVVFYVHGTTGDFGGAIDFPVLFGPLAARYPVERYEYHEDRGNAVAGDPTFTCQPGKQRPIPTFDPTPFSRYGFTPDSPDGQPGTCDSNDDIELNGVLLDADIADLLRDFDRVTLVANSGGAAIVRAYLAYAAAAPTDTLGRVDTLAGVDLVVSLEGVQAGTYLAALVSGADLARPDRPIGSLVRRSGWDYVKPALLHDPRRPVFDDVLPQGPFQQYVARREAVPDQPHYLNVVGDLVVNVRYFFLWWEFRSPDTVEFGDFVMLPGSDDPTALQPLGGARFLPASVGRGRSSAQWVLRREFDVVADSFSSSGPGGALVAGISAAATDPAMHLNLSRMDEICVQVPSAAGPVPEHLHQALFNAIASLDRGTLDRERLGFGNLGRVQCP